MSNDEDLTKKQQKEHLYSELKFLGQNDEGLGKLKPHTVYRGQDRCSES